MKQINVSYPIQETAYMVDNDFMLAKKSGISPDKLLLDKSLEFVKFIRKVS